MPTVDEIKKRISSGSCLCLSADVDNILDLDTLMKSIRNRHELNVTILKIHPDIIGFWSVNSEIWLQDWAKRHRFLLWADIKLCDVPHIVKMKLQNMKHWADIVTIMSTIAIPEVLDEIHEDLEKGEMVAFVVPALHTNGKKIWEDPKSGELEGILPHYPNVIGSVGMKIPGLLYVKAGVSDDEDLEGVDIVVRGRSLIKELLQEN